jgi:hypothetical protein
MTNHQYVQVERTLLKRGVTDFERKLKAAAASGALGYAVLQVVAALGYHLPAQVAELIPVGIALIGGWWTHSAAVTTTFSDTNDGYSVRVGPAGTPVGEPKPLTGAIPVPRPLPDPEPLPEVPDAAPQSFTEVVTADDQATKVYSPGAAFWAARNENTDNGLSGN